MDEEQYYGKDLPEIHEDPRDYSAELKEEPQLFNFEDNNIRIVTINNEPWIVHGCL